ncbi:MAG TPA: DNA polymerase III subunit delta [Solirubrobacteraceae bacterium]|nr:DNA polymerase III subunit delta [Solirubrobacteraceae bacterium]
MPSFKPAYLIHGDDHGRIAERRARLRAMAEQESGTQGVEVFEGDAATPEAVAGALNALTFALGRRFIVVDGVERWTDKQLDPLVAALEDIPPDTTVAFFAREDGRTRAPKRLHDAIKKAGGDIAAEESVKPWELPKWVIARARELNLQLEPDTARALIAQVGDRQQRLLRELEKLALYAGPGARIDASLLDELAAPSAEHRAWSLADTIVSGDAQAATALYLTLRSQGERLPGLLYWMSTRVRTAHEVAIALEQGTPPAQIKRGLRMPSKAADRLIADANRAGSESLQRTIEELAELELASRGGGSGGAGEDTSALLAIQRIAAA